MKLIWYKNRVAGPFDELTKETIEKWKSMVDDNPDVFPYTDFLNDNMREYPDDVHIIEKRK